MCGIAGWIEKDCVMTDRREKLRAMSETLERRGPDENGMYLNGDTALCEAAASAPSFLKLVSLGVPFPANEYGEYVGYQTDHDTRRRATSAGPLTSKYMTEPWKIPFAAGAYPYWIMRWLPASLPMKTAWQRWMCI